MKGIMIQGTASNVGKSLLTTGLCRLFANKGYAVAPFKAQNMSNNIFLAEGDKEMSIAQAQQAEAAKIIPSALMNPVLLMPHGNGQTEVVLLGEKEKIINGGDYKKSYYSLARQTILTALKQLHQQSELLVIEGAGSPVEMNLKDRELANMAVAEMADVPVILVADIDRGGAFASIVGTLELLTKEERNRVKGVIINKFRGDIDSFSSGIDWLEAYTGLPVLGVVPHVEHELAEEDSLSELSTQGKTSSPPIAANKEVDYENLAAHLEKYLDWKRLQSIMLGEEHVG